MAEPYVPTAADHLYAPGSSLVRWLRLTGTVATLAGFLILLWCAVEIRSLGPGFETRRLLPSPSPEILLAAARLACTLLTLGCAANYFVARHWQFVVNRRLPRALATIVEAHVKAEPRRPSHSWPDLARLLGVHRDGWNLLVHAHLKHDVPGHSPEQRLITSRSHHVRKDPAEREAAYWRNRTTVQIALHPQHPEYAYTLTWRHPACVRLCICTVLSSLAAAALWLIP